MKFIFASPATARAVGLACVFALIPGAALAQTQVQGQPPANSPACQRLIAQLTSLDAGNADPARADKIRRSEDAVNRQQFEVDRLVEQGRRSGCERSGFFSIFNNPPPECGALNRQIGQQRSNLERMQNDLEQLQGGTAQRAAQRQSLLIALGDNGCGSQYRSAAQQGQQGGFFDRLFGGNSANGPNGPGGPDGTISSTPNGPMGSTYRTICVRSCDGYYYPISFATTPDHFREDEQACQRTCPAAQVSLYTYHNPGEEVSQAVSLNGQFYSELPNAFAYRKAINPACSCRKPGESWAEALKTIGGDTTVAPGDLVVTDHNAKQLSQPRIGANGKPIDSDQPNKSAIDNRPAEKAMVEAPGTDDPTKRKVRTVGPSFLPVK
jgi:hypothetical protein